MVNFNDAIDLVRRRTNNYIQRDGIDSIYIKFIENKEKANIIFTLKDDISSDELTKLAVRYNHLLEDHLDTYSVSVLPATNHFKKDMDTYAIWVYSKGFDV